MKGWLTKTVKKYEMELQILLVAVLLTGFDLLIRWSLSSKLTAGLFVWNLLRAIIAVSALFVWKNWRNARPNLVKLMAKIRK